MVDTVDFSNLLNELQASPNVNDVRLHLEVPVTDLILVIFQEAFSFSLDPALLPVYKFANGIHLIWHYKFSERATIGGEVDIRGCLDTFSEDARAVLGCETNASDKKWNDEFE